MFHHCGEKMRWVHGSQNNSHVARRVTPLRDDVGHWWCASCKQVELKEESKK